MVIPMLTFRIKLLLLRNIFRKVVNIMAFNIRKSLTEDLPGFDENFDKNIKYFAFTYLGFEKKISKANYNFNQSIFKKIKSNIQETDLKKVKHKYKQIIELVIILTSNEAVINNKL